MCGSNLRCLRRRVRPLQSMSLRCSARASGIGAAVAEIVVALRALEAGPDLVPYTLSARARLQRDAVPSETRFVPIPARVLLRSWVRSEAPRIDRWLAPAQVLHATNYLAPPSRLPEMVSVYDCSFVRYPELCTPEVRAFDPVIRRAVARGATLHTGSEFVADEIEEIYGMGLRAAGRLVVIPLGIPALGDASEMPAAVAAAVGDAPFVVAIGTLEPRKNFGHLVGAFGELAARHPDLRLVIAGHDGPARPEVEAAIRAPPGRERARGSWSRGQCRTRGGERSSSGPRCSRTRRSTRASGSRSSKRCRWECRWSRPAPARSPRWPATRALLVEPTNEAALADEMDRVITDDATRAELVARGRDRVHAFSWDHTARALASCYRRLAAPRSV